VVSDAVVEATTSTSRMAPHLCSLAPQDVSEPLHFRRPAAGLRPFCALAACISDDHYASLRPAAGYWRASKATDDGSSEAHAYGRTWWFRRPTCERRMGDKHDDGDSRRRAGGRRGWHGMELVIYRGLLECVDPSWPSPPNLSRPSHLSGELHTTGELYTTKLHTSTSLHSETARKYYAESACCKCMLQVFQRYIASVSSG
jgi:hypothetical protein